MDALLHEALEVAMVDARRGEVALTRAVSLSQGAEVGAHLAGGGGHQNEAIPLGEDQQALPEMAKM